MRNHIEKFIEQEKRVEKLNKALAQKQMYGGGPSFKVW